MNVDDAWSRNHRNIKPQEIVNNIADWIDEDSASRNGGSESDYYQDTDPLIKPPNRSMKTLDELHMVAGVTDDIYNILAPKLTLWGDKGINVNYASKDILRSIDPQITDQIADAIVTRRTDESKGHLPTSRILTPLFNLRGLISQPLIRIPPPPSSLKAELIFE